MCTKICDYRFTISQAGKLLDEEFEWINLMQVLFIYNNHEHVSYLDILNQLGILFYMIQYTTEDGRLARITIVWDHRKTSTYNMIKKLKKIEKENSKGKYKLTIIV